MEKKSKNYTDKADDSINFMSYIFKLLQSFHVKSTENGRVNYLPFPLLKRIPSYFLKHFMKMLVKKTSNLFL